MAHSHGPNEDDAHEGGEDAFDLELAAQGQIFLEMRSQNLELLRIAAQVAGFGGEHPPVKPADMKNALRAVWEAYSEFYSWIDPEEAEGDDDDEDELD
jgi:hypothetical protein